MAYAFVYSDMFDICLDNGLLVSYPKALAHNHKSATNMLPQNDTDQIICEQVCFMEILLIEFLSMASLHDDVIKWKHFPRYWPLVRGIHRSPVNSPHKGQWRGALVFSLICVWISSRVNNREAGDLRRYRAHYDINVMV